MKHLLKKLVGGGSDRPSFKKKYKLGGVLGEGSCGVVHVAVDLVDGKEWACKIITKETERRLAREEIRLLQRLSHPNVLQYREHFDKRSKLCIVTELLRGQDLFSDIEERGSYTEEQSRVIMKQLLEGIAHMHSRNIVHRDLKLENVMLRNKDGSLDLCIVDFGFAEELEDETPRVADRRGSLDYASPEVLSSEAAPGCSGDVWSAGVMFYALLSKTFPFFGKTVGETRRSIQRAAVSFQDPVWDTRSEAAKDMVQAMLVRDAAKRPTARQLLSHPWILNGSPPTSAPEPGTEAPRASVPAAQAASIADSFTHATSALTV
eukprot:jgi/Tetstr1/461236/TSEL_006366.t1